ncbi:hypothetical protein BSL78_29367 [Apostichopus japonicus]|uniref:Integrase catalytic domain-containing protein n=1 Tax=Stichopus japonicus TaxID=307972 RepID=A0A2G8JDJ8_STIJA|nr:hypothetical protein BSL78_29367 [Apostichopus japonicus]
MSEQGKDKHEPEGEAMDSQLEPQLSHLENQPNPQDDSEASLVRRGIRDRKLTEKAQQNLDEEIHQRNYRVEASYEKWRQRASEIRKALRKIQPLDQLLEFQSTIKKLQDSVVTSYEELRRINVPDKVTVSKVDNCCAISRELTEVLTQRRLEEIDTHQEREQIRGLKCAHPSVFGESISDQSVQSRMSVVSTISSMKAKADAEKAEKLAAAKALREEQHQKSKLLQMQMNLEEEKMKLEAMQADAAVRIAEAKCEVLSEAAEDPEDICLDKPVRLNPLAASFNPVPHYDGEPYQELSVGHALGGESINNPVSESSLAQALTSAMDRSRLPVPTPKAFSGNPIEFVTFKRSFKTLIENKGTRAEEKIYYLQQYVTGEARESIAGCFYGSNESDYQRAWETLEKRYGHPFKVQEAFRDRLDKWPKVGLRDNVALQNYADFLNSCRDAMPHVKGLSILNDCKENQKMTAKLPDWAISRWSRVVTAGLDEGHDYPTFTQFVSFVEKEARVVCNPIASFLAVKRSESACDSKFQVEKRKFSRALVTDAGKSPNRWSQHPNDDLKGGYSSSSAKPVEKPKTCPFCNGEHYLSSCTVFADKSIDERNSFIQVHKRCYSCLRTGHFAKQCKSRHSCQKCKGRHPTVLHDNDKIQRVFTQEVKREPKEADTAVALTTYHGHSSTTNVLPVWVSSISSPQTEKLVYALLDTQSDSTFIDGSICEELLVPTDPVKLELTTMRGKDSTVVSKRAKGLRVRGYTSSKCIDLPVTYTTDFIPLDKNHIPTCETAKNWNHLASIASEMPPLMDCEVGLLIGYNCSAALAPRQVITGENDQPYAVKTDLGWSVVGSLAPVDSTEVTGFCHRISLKEAPPVTPRDILKVFESDFNDSKHESNSISQDDIRFLQILESSVAVNEKGHIEMPLPFKSRPYLPNNYKLAAIRLSHLKRRLDGDPNYKEHYVKFVEGMLEDGDAVQVADRGKPGEVYYIPHHGVYHPKKPNKLRVVFDCSAKYRGSSLNDHLLCGPDLTNNLFGVLCRFRRHPVAVMCDVEKMFHRFHVSPEDRDYLRFLWYKGGDTKKEPLEYRMNVHLFGATSSPGCANFGMKHLSRMFEEEFSLAAPFLRQDFYVDDGVTSVKNAREAKELIKEACELCSKGNLRLHKFVSNDRSVIEDIPLSERATDVQDIDLSRDKLPVERTLGIHWNIEDDSFTFQIGLKERPDTRRGILSVVASIYDPLGFIAPFVLEGKAILQRMCKQGTSWDEPVTDELRPRWEKWKSDILNLENTNIPRCYKPLDFGPATRVELHHFSDASTDGYGMCSYLRFIREDHVYCSLVIGKARVSPTKVVTVPRLELTAAVVAVKISIKLKQELHMHIDSEYFWCDSQVVLAYINNDAKRFHVFVSNRVQFIKEHTEPNQWHYISTRENPADHASRGLCVSELLSSNWFTGPEFLWSADPVTDCSIEPMLIMGDPEVRAQSLSVQATRACDILERLSKYSNWSRLTRIVARIRRLASRETGSVSLTVEEINQACVSVVKIVQQEHFKEELQALKMQRNVSSTSKLFTLNPFIQDGMIRVGGRLRKSMLSLNEKHPVVLPKNGHMTELIIAHCHSLTKHQGRGQTINEIRRQGYWILGGSKTVATFTRKCVLCRKLRRPVEEQKMADLPEDRVEPSPPFSFCGMDCFGPFITKQNRKEFKRYGLIFTCLCSRAVHIEMVEDLSTDAFINALRCFIAIRGAVTQIRCDHGSNFIGADNELRAALKELDVNQMTAYLTQKQCNFVFNAPYSSHAGGVWERQIRSVRNVFNATIALYPGRLDDASLKCFLYEAMAIINGRPLTPANMTDPSAEPPLTPNHLITMKPTVALPPPGHFVKEDLYARRRWRRVQFLSEQFWSRWKSEYLQTLQERGKWSLSRRNLRVGDVVLVKDHDTPRMKWPFGV